MRLALLLAFLGTQAVAAPMTRSDCVNSWQKLMDLGAEFQSSFGIEDDESIPAGRSIEPQVTSDGWCRLKGGTVGLENAAFATFDWQADGIAAFIEDGTPTETLALRIDGVKDETGAPTYDILLRTRLLRDNGLLLVEEFDFADADGDFISLSAVFDGAWFGSLASAQSSFGGLTLQQMAARVEVAPGRINLIDGGVAELENVIALLLDGLTAAQLPDPSRAALKALREDLPGARGTLNLRAVSERGLGWMQIAAAETFHTDATEAERLGFALSGVTLGVDWDPVD